MLQMDYSITTTSGNITFLVLWHFWANSFAGVAANHWNVGPRFALQCTTTSTVALKLKDLGFMLTGKLLFKFSLYI